MSTINLDEKIQLLNLDQHQEQELHKQPSTISQTTMPSLQQLLQQQPSVTQIKSQLSTFTEQLLFSALSPSTTPNTKKQSFQLIQFAKQLQKHCDQITTTQINFQVQFGHELSSQQKMIDQQQLQLKQLQIDFEQQIIQQQIQYEQQYKDLEQEIKVKLLDIERREFELNKNIERREFELSKNKHEYELIQQIHQNNINPLLFGVQQYNNHGNNNNSNNNNDNNNTNDLNQSQHNQLYYDDVPKQAIMNALHDLHQDYQAMKYLVDQNIIATTTFDQTCVDLREHVTQQHQCFQDDIQIQFQHQQQQFQQQSQHIQQQFQQQSQQIQQSQQQFQESQQQSQQQFQQQVQQSQIQHTQIQTQQTRYIQQLQDDTAQLQLSLGQIYLPVCKQLPLIDQLQSNINTIDQTIQLVQKDMISLDSRLIPLEVNAIRQSTTQSTSPTQSKSTSTTTQSTTQSTPTTTQTTANSKVSSTTSNVPSTTTITTIKTITAAMINTALVANQQLQVSNPPSMLISFHFDNIPGLYHSCHKTCATKTLFEIFYRCLVDNWLQKDLTPFKTTIQASKLYISSSSVLNGQWIQIQGQGGLINIISPTHKLKLIHFLKPGDDIHSYQSYPCSSNCKLCRDAPKSRDKTSKRYIIKFKWV